MPLHWRRRLSRGYNQSMEIARTLSKQLNIPINPHYCRRVRHTQTQSQLPFKQRAANVRGVFHIKKPKTYRNIAIIDDVVTTGSTVNTLAKKLKKTGVEHVAVWTLARAVKKVGG